MEWEFIAPMVVLIVFMLTTGGVILLRPISKRLSDLLEIYAREKDAGAARELRQMRELFETMDQRLRLIEERQDFTEKMLESGPRERIPDAAPDRIASPRAQLPPQRPSA